MILFDILTIIFSVLSCICFILFVVSICVTANRINKFSQEFISLFTSLWMFAFAFSFVGANIILCTIFAFLPIFLLILFLMIGLIWWVFSDLKGENKWKLKKKLQKQ